MNTIRIVMRREFSTRVRGKGYLAATLLGLVAIVALFFAPSLFSAMGSGSTLKIAVIDRTGQIYPRLVADLTETLANGKPAFVLSPASGSVEDITAQVKSGTFDAALVIGSATAGGAGYQASVVSKEEPYAPTLARVSAAVTSAATFLRLQALGVSAQQAADAFAPVPLQTQVVGSGPKSGGDTAANWALTYVLVILLYMTTLIYGVYVAMGVIEEKSTRVVEIIVSTVRPFQLMMGKVLGIGLVALVQYLVWLAAGFALLVLSGRGTNVSVGPLKLSIGSVDPWLLLAFALFFLVGFFSYAGLFAAGGSMVSRTEDAQQVTTPLTWILVLVFFFAIYAMSNPDKPLSVAMSMIPLLSPIVMFVRVALGHPPVWQVVLSLALSLGAILGLIWAAAKIFRAGVLMYGRRMKLSALVKALR